MSKTSGLTQGPPDAGEAQMPTSMPPLGPRCRLELSSWYCQRAPTGGCQRCVAPGAWPAATSAIIASSAAADKATYWPWLVPTTSQMM
jgi:hypothetical protein